MSFGVPVPGVIPLREMISGAFGVPTWDFYPDAVVFDPGMAKRSTSVFAASPIVQGKWDGTGTGDVLSFSRGSQISGHFYDNFDTNQGTISFWITPEWAGDDGLRHDVLNFGNFVIYKTGNLLYIYYGSNGAAVNVSGWTAGTTYYVVSRWDGNNTIDGLNYNCVSVNNSHTFGDTSVTIPTPDTTGYIGSTTAAGTQANALIEGLTIYRRVWFDGTYGTDVGNGDEIAQVYNAGSGQDPALITGDKDIVFQAPTNATPGEITTGNGNAHSFPHSLNAITDGYCETTYGSSGWTTEGTPSDGPKDTAIANTIFGGIAYEWTSDAADEGIEQTITGLTPGDNVYLTAYDHCTSANAIRLLIYDEDNAANILQYDFGASSSRTTPGVADVSFEVPALCNNVSVHILSTAASQTIYHHQIIWSTNLWDDPGIETGTAVTDVGTPTTSAQDAGQAHSGTNSWKIVSDAIDEGGSRAITVTNGNFYHVSGWVYADTTGTVDMDVTGAEFQDGSTTDKTSSTNDAWEWLSGVVRATSTTLTLRFLSNGSQTFYFDDIAVVELDNVSLTVTPASQANSAESGGIRVDGYDNGYDLIEGITAQSGLIRFSFYLRHDDPDWLKFGNTTPVLAQAWGDATNYIYLEESAINTLQIRFNDGGGEHSTTWATGGTLPVDTKISAWFEWSPAYMRLWIDGIIVATINESVSFTTILSRLYVGSNQAGTQQADAVFAAP